MIPFVKARWFTTANRAPADIDYLVIHCTESHDSPAMNVARYFQTTDRKASAHEVIDGRPDDGNNIIQCVRLKDVAYAAKSANRFGYHFELCGDAAQTRAQWLDPYGLRLIPRAAARLRAVGEMCGIPLVFVNAAGLKAGKRGITTHAEISKAWPSTGHTDPGPNFPLDVLFNHLTEEDIVTPQDKEDIAQRAAAIIFERLTAGGTGVLAKGWDPTKHASILENVEDIVPRVRAIQRKLDARDTQPI